MNRSVTRAQMEAYARVLCAAKDSHLLVEPAAKNLHARFKATDKGGTVWTVGIRTLEWNCSINGKWTKAEAPQALFLDEDVAGILDALGQKQSPAQAAPGPQPSLSAAPPPEPPRALPPPMPEPPRPTGPIPRPCEKCGKLLIPGAAFCAQCGTPVMPTVKPAEPPAPPRCTNIACGRPLPPEAMFCPACGTKAAKAGVAPVPAAPPPVQPPAHNDEPPPAPPPPRPPPRIKAPRPRAGLCPSCRAQNAPGKKFCTRCGAKLPS